MMLPRPLLVWVVTGVLCGTALGLSLPRALGARARAQAALANLAVTDRQCREVLRLRRAIGALHVAAIDQDPQSLAPRLSGVLHSCGLDASTLTSVAPHGAVAPVPAGPGNGAGSLTQRRASVTLTGLTLPQAGKFLQAWRSREPAWVIISIDLGPATSPGPAATIGGDLPLQIDMQLDSLCLNQGHEGSRR